MWRLFHWLFGWHYVSVYFGWDHPIRRVHIDGNGRPYVRLYGEHVDLNGTSRKWYPLTFSTTEASPPSFSVVDGSRDGGKPGAA